jgi:glutathione synthase
MMAKPRSSRKLPFRFLWITDPWETLDHPKDTTLRLAEESLALGHESFWCDVHSISWADGRVVLDARKILQVYPGRLERSFELDSALAASPREFDNIHYRTDPPIDLAYLQPLQLLQMGLDAKAAPKPARAKGPKARRAELVNPATVLFLGNEKLEAAALPELMPATFVSSQREALEAFGRAEGRAVLKPLHQAQSKGIELLDWREPEGAARAREKLAAATEGFTRPILLQRFLPGIAEGEKRLWFVDGKLLAVVRKLPLPGDFRVDMDRGSRLAPARLDARERKAAARIGKHLSSRRIRLAAVDLIEGLVTDFNFTSPGLITGMENVLGENLAKPIIRALTS